MRRMGALQLGDQKPGAVLGDRKDHRALGRVVGKPGRIDDVVIGIEQQQIDIGSRHALADIGVNLGVEIGAEHLMESHSGLRSREG